MVAGDMILSIAAVNFTLQSGSDPSPSSRLIGGPFIASATQAAQRVANLVGGCVYTLQIIVNTEAGDTLSLYSHIQARVVF